MSEKRVTIDGRERKVRLEREGDRWTVHFEDDTPAVDVEIVALREDAAEVRVGDRTLWLPLFVRGETVEFSMDGELWRAQVETAAAGGRGRRQADHSMSAPMPGQVLKIFVETGDVVAKGDPLIVLEAMKMEHQIAAPYDGRVASIACRVGELVQPGVDLISVAPEEVPEGSR